MTLEQLLTLSRIVEYGTLKRAADSLHKTQPALSMAIKKLEEEYGFRILNRDSYRLSLTQEGRLFYSKAQELLLNAQQLSSLGQHLADGNESLIRFAYDLACPTSMMLDVLKRCHSLYPDTEFQIMEKTRFGALELLHKDQADLAISPWWPTLYAAGDLDTLPIGEFTILLAASPELFGGAVVNNTGQLRSQVHLVIEKSAFEFDSENLILLKGVRTWKTQSANTLKQLLLAGLGWGFIPEHMIRDELASGTLVALQPEDMEYAISGEVRLLRNQKSSLGPVSKMLWQAFAEFRQ
ncbi:LysR family transcriptional regulator [uncultured Amphritea sp.]|uniref:LysR family transcriptional regulator n=1 Tax=uncultured Amphritea sp. TaxID=981605 RepID=UPI0026389F85|nr:LysR family transcriptional regulator [uncultured Amphritea sp.]